MKSTLIIGIILIVLGIIALVYPHFSFTTHDTKTANLGPLKLQADVPHHHSVNVPEVLGVIALVGGIVVIVVGVAASKK